MCYIFLWHSNRIVNRLIWNAGSMLLLDSLGGVALLSLIELWYFRFKLGRVALRAWTGQVWWCKCIWCGLNVVDMESQLWMKCVVRLQELRFNLPNLSFILYVILLKCKLKNKNQNQKFCEGDKWLALWTKQNMMVRKNKHLKRDTNTVFSGLMLEPRKIVFSWSIFFFWAEEKVKGGEIWVIYFPEVSTQMWKIWRET